MEEWKPIPDYPDYQVSNLGRVRSLKYGKERVLNPIKHNSGYLHVVLYKKGRNSITIHSLVAMTFLDHVPNGHSSVVDHINSIKTDNRLENLRIVSHRQNIEFGFLKKSTSSKYTGVYWHKPAKKWKAQIRINGKQKHLGLFNTEEEAAQVYEEALKQINV